MPDIEVTLKITISGRTAEVYKQWCDDGADNCPKNLQKGERPPAIEPEIEMLNGVTADLVQGLDLYIGADPDDIKVELIK